MKKVTIVVPVYQDWDSLQICLDSLKECVEEKHKVIIVNDQGPNCVEMEQLILQTIKGHFNFAYFKNPKNLGFVGTCNRAVEELDTSDNDILLLNSDTRVTKGFLDEMQKVLYTCEKHGVVCPRSNNATILTMPVKNNTGKLLADPVSYHVFLQIKDKLPQFHVIPTGVGFAMLIKRDLIRRFGLFDEAYSPGYNEENDFCMRINQYGYNVVVANRAYVYHDESKSFGAKKNDLEIKNHKTLLGRYPYYDGIVDKYFNHNISPIEYYADLIVEHVYEKKRILFSLYEIPASFNGTAEYGLSILKHFYELFSDKYDIHVLINDMADELFGVSQMYPHVWHPHTIKETFHLAFAPSQIFHMEHLIILNRVSLNYVFCMQDIISLRSSYLLAGDWERYDVFQKSIHYCAAMTSISQFSLQDTMGYFYDEFQHRDIKTKVIYQGITDGPVKCAGDKLPFADYYMVFGNFYKHKFLDETMPYLKKITDENFIVLGSETGKIADNIYGYKSGQLADEFINLLLKESKAILFPSIYEGFGLPILHGIKFDKKVILCNNDLNRELKKEFDNFSDNVYLFDSLADLGPMIKEISSGTKVLYKGGKKSVRTWYDTAKELESFLESVLEEKVDLELLQERWKDLCYISDVHRMYVAGQEKPLEKTGRILKFKIYLHDNYPRVFLLLRKVKQMLKRCG